MSELNPFLESQYDILIVGGGINGAAIAHLAAKRGLTVALVEKGDFASGTSSKSTKLIHGGLRYLENFEFGLVKESLRERSIQLEAAPHLVRPISIVIPIYEGDQRPKWMMRFGCRVYDVLAGKRNIAASQGLSVEEVQEKIPNLKKAGLKGGVLYYDAVMDDARLCLENVLAARSHGAHVANYTALVSLFKENGRVTGGRCRNEINGDLFDIHAKEVVCTVGPWTNLVMNSGGLDTVQRVRLTKGVHLVYQESLTEQALLIQAQDGRVFFVTPFHGHSLIGTTDTDFTQNPDEIAVSNNDIEYLLNETRRIFDRTDISQDKIVTAFAGLRPLAYKEGSPGNVSRHHAIQKANLPGITCVIGGKYTTYRKIAEDCLKVLYPNQESEKDSLFRIYGSEKDCPIEAGESGKYGADGSLILHLKGIYGCRYKEILEMTVKHPELKEKICPCCYDIAAQAAYAIVNEMARSADDVIWRRMHVGYRGCPTGNCQKSIEKIIQKWIKKY